MGKLNRYLSAINTTYNPSFVIPNFFRDLETAGVNIQQYDEKGLTKEITLGAGRAAFGIAKALKDRNSNDPSLMAQNNNTIAKGERNKVGLSFLNLIRGQEEQADGSIATNATLATEMNKIGEDVTGQSVQDRRGRGINPEDELEIRAMDRDWET